MLMLPAYNFTLSSPDLTIHFTVLSSAVAGSIVGFNSSDSWCSSVMGAMVMLVTFCTSQAWLPGSSEPVETAEPSAKKNSQCLLVAREV